MSQLWEGEEEQSSGKVLWAAVHSHSLHLGFPYFQNPKRRELPSNSSVSSVAVWILPTSSSVPSASVPWLVQRGECPQSLFSSSPFPFPGLYVCALHCILCPWVILHPNRPSLWLSQLAVSLACLKAASCHSFTKHEKPDSHKQTREQTTESKDRSWCFSLARPPAPSLFLPLAAAVSVG